MRPKPFSEPTKLNSALSSSSEVNSNNIINQINMEKSISLLAHAIQSIGECVSITDMNDQIVYVNSAFLKTYGYEEHELIGNSISLVRSPNNPSHVTEKILPATLQGGWQGEILNLRKNGNEFSVFISTSVVRDDKGEPIALIGVTSDITQRKKVEKSLLESENRLRSITDSAQDAILMMDPKGLISFWNPSAERIFGYTSTQAIGKNLHSLIVPERFHKANIDALPAFLKSGQGPAIGKTLDLQATKNDGTEIDVQLSLSAISINSQWHAVGILRDITEQKKTEAALVKAKLDSEAANKSKSVFLANMSHEIRTPLNAIIGFSQLMNRDKQLSTTLKEYSFSIIRAGEHLLALINDILELSKVEAGRVELNPVNVDLYTLLDDIQLLFKERIQSKNLQLICEKSNNLPRYVFLDEHKVRQIFVNLIGNALKFTDQGGIAVRSRLDIIDDDSKYLIVEVQDSGPGIAKEEIHKLFKHFEQTSSGISKGSGTGLGLALSRELAILMGGDITVTSEVGKGSVFTFSIQIKEGNSEMVEKIVPKSVTGIENGQPAYRILVVDDKDENLKVAVTLLNMVGFETREARNGEEAIAKFQEWNPSLILMDMRMPVMDGYEASRLIKSTEKGKNTPIVALTASTFEDELNKIDLLSIQGYIRKPFRENELFNTIGKLLGIKYLYDQELPVSESKYSNNISALSDDVTKLSTRLILKMQQALAVADLDLLIELIQSIEVENMELADQLRTLAQNYDYDQLQLILNTKEN